MGKIMKKTSWVKASLCTATACLSSFVSFNLSDARADYTRVNSVSGVKLADVAISCDFRLRVLAGTTSDNSYSVTYVGQNFSQGYILEASLTSAQVQELIRLQNFFVSRTPIILGTPAPGSTHSLRVAIPTSTTASPSVALLSGGQNFAVNTAALDLEKQCATTSAVSVQGGGTDGCAMLAFKEFDGSCRCAVDPLASPNPCATLYTKTCVKGSWDPITKQQRTKCIGPVDQYLSRFYFFNANTCACELCDPTVATRGADGASCSCKFGNLGEVLAIAPNPQPISQFDALRNKCTTLLSSNFTGGTVPGPNRLVYFDKKACSCSVCPSGYVANTDQSGCVKL